MQAAVAWCIVRGKAEKTRGGEWPVLKRLLQGTCIESLGRKVEDKDEDEGSRIYALLDCFYRPRLFAFFFWAY